MGIRNYLIDGVSGAGKTTVARELEQRGYHVIHGDRTLAYYGDPETGEPLGPLPAEFGNDEMAWWYARWIWPVTRVKSMLAGRSHPMTFFCGGSRNSHRFIDLFDQAFLLEVDLDTLDQRLAARKGDEFGGTPAQRAIVVQVHATGEGLTRNAVKIDATRPVEQVVDEILSLCLTPGDN
jgi:adenylate kinase family enzyme